MEGHKKSVLLRDRPVTVYPQKYLDVLWQEIEEARAKIASGEQTVFDNMDELLATLAENDGE